MSYTESLLASGERPSASHTSTGSSCSGVPAGRSIGVVIAIALTILRVISSGTDGLLWTLLGWATLILLVIGLAMLGWGALQYRAEEYVISTRRIIHVDGVVNKTRDGLVAREDQRRHPGRVDLRADLRLRGPRHPRPRRKRGSTSCACCVTRRTSRRPCSRPSTSWRSSSIGRRWRPSDRPGPHPELRRHPQRPPRPTPEVDTADEVADALDRLGDLRDRGILTPEEFAAKKAELLGRL